MNGTELLERVLGDPRIALGAAAGILLTLLLAARVLGARARAEAHGRVLAELASRHFLVQPCARCHESEMELVSVSPNARSIVARCRYCGKQTHAPAASEEAFAARERFERWERARARVEARDPGAAETLAVVFTTPEAPLPFEQTRREPIPEAVRAEVWRRDGGRCVSCGGNQGLEFDHIIPVARGGATSVRNLQLLCKACNLRKGERI